MTKENDSENMWRLVSSYVDQLPLAKNPKRMLAQLIVKGTSVVLRAVMSVDITREYVLALHSCAHLFHYTPPMSSFWIKKNINHVSGGVSNINSLNEVSKLTRT